MGRKGELRWSVLDQERGDKIVACIRAYKIPTVLQSKRANFRAFLSAIIIPKAIQKDPIWVCGRRQGCTALLEKSHVVM